MDGFKSMPKMQSFKTGGHVKKQEYCSGGPMKKGGKVEDKGDLSQDKALIKKAIAQHDKQEHPGEKTELKLKNGGRSKKAKGSVKKFKAGGLTEAKEELKEATKKPAAKSAAKCSGGKVKALATGGSTGAMNNENIPTRSPIPPAIAAQLMQAKQDAALLGNNPSPLGGAPIPGDNPVMGGASTGGNPLAALLSNIQQPNTGMGMGMGMNRGQGAVSNADRVMQRTGAQRPGMGVNRGQGAVTNAERMNPAIQTLLNNIVNQGR